MYNLPRLPLNRLAPDWELNPNVTLASWTNSLLKSLCVSDFLATVFQLLSSREKVLLPSFFHHHFSFVRWSWEFIGWLATVASAQIILRASIAATPTWTGTILIMDGRSPQLFCLSTNAHRFSGIPAPGRRGRLRKELDRIVQHRDDHRMETNK